MQMLEEVVKMIEAGLNPKDAAELMGKVMGVLAE